MKETKVYVDELPKSCFECQIMTDGSEGCDYCICAILEEKAETKNRLKDCPLHSIKDHDRELVKEVCEKIRKTIASTVDLAESNQQIKDQFNIILDLVEKEFEENARVGGRR